MTALVQDILEHKPGKTQQRMVIFLKGEKNMNYFQFKNNSIVLLNTTTRLLERSDSALFHN